MESIPGNDPSINNPCIYKHVYRFKTAIVLSAIAVEIDIEQVAMVVMHGLSEWVEIHVSCFVALKYQHKKGHFKQCSFKSICVNVNNIHT